MDSTLASFTDVLDAEICDSQPISLSPSIDSNDKWSATDTNTARDIQDPPRPFKGCGQRGEFRSTEEIVAPVKALCTERLTEWYPKFTKLGLLCIEATGDTDVDFSQLQPYNNAFVPICNNLLSLETTQSSAQSVHRIEKLQNQLQGSAVTHKAAPSIRFVAVSATVSNPEDVANWLGTSNKSAVFHSHHYFGALRADYEVSRSEALTKIEPRAFQE
ncbi:unnamed protein product [Arctia plantaginis]|uniref:Uncharacterized protein n=1 Tax=Arctia plantaginis TaxID=874455 RepID=A0A8S0ZUB7_ARCPL|nr:unnamed protein product [Arctia plantaginis]